MTFEFKVIELDLLQLAAAITDRLNLEAKDGWDLVGVTRDEIELHLYLKRPLNR